MKVVGICLLEEEEEDEEEEEEEEEEEDGEMAFPFLRSIIGELNEVLEWSSRSLVSIIGVGACATKTLACKIHLCDAHKRCCGFCYISQSISAPPHHLNGGIDEHSNRERRAE